MGTWPLWIAFNAGVALLLVLDLGLFHRRPHAIALREAAMESAAWIALSLGFGAWIFVSHGRGLGLEFFTGYVVEKSLSLDNVFVFYSGFKLFGADHAVHPEKNPLVRWARKIMPMSQTEAPQNLLVREGGQWLFTSFFLVLIVLETTDLVLAVDSIAAVFGVTRDPFIVYSSNVCAILGLRAVYFLLAGILQYFQYLDEGLAITVMFIGAKMLADPWVNISTGFSLSIVGAIIALAILISVIRAKLQAKSVKPPQKEARGMVRSV